MIIEPFRPVHLDVLRAQGVQAAQAREVSHVPASYASVSRAPGTAVTARMGDRILLCGGVTTVDAERGVLWALLSVSASAHLVRLHRGVERFLSVQRPRRLEATVEEGFGPGCRWLELLGFEYEGRMRGYGMNGETHLRYARVLGSSG